jgi:hypothetical protein
MDGFGGVSGVDILSLNPRFVNQYIDNNLKVLSMLVDTLSHLPIAYSVQCFIRSC